MHAGHNIRSIEIEERRLTLAGPLATGAGTLRERVVLFFVVRGADGVTGIGESAPLPGAGTEGVAASRAALDRARTTLLQGRPAGMGTTPAASSAVDLALLDLTSRRLGLPLCRHLVSRPAEDVGVNALLGDSTIEALALSADAAVQAGFRTLKIKVGAGDLTHDLARVAAVCAAVGPRVRLRLDANGAWALEEALRALNGFAGHPLEMIEQPVAAGPDDIAQLALLRRSSPIPIAADESATSPERVQALLDEGAVDAVILKLMRIGGLERALSCARRAQSVGIPAVITSFLGSAVERTAALHLAAAIDPENPVSLDHGLATAGWLTADVAPGQPVIRGRMAVPTGAGNGVAVPTGAGNGVAAGPSPA